MNYIKEILLICLGASLGASSRYSLKILLCDGLGWAEEMHIFFVNLSGCLIIGFVSAKLTNFEHKVFLLSGFISSYTTFSTYCLQVSGLWGSGRELLAIGYSLGSLLIGVLLFRLGDWLGHLQLPAN